MSSSEQDSRVQAESVEAPAGPVEKNNSQEFNTVVWAAWPVISWVLPALLLLFLFSSGSGGWEMLFLLFASPILLPIVALLGLLPRWIRRRKIGIDASNTPLSISLIVNWWAMVLAAVTRRGVGDSGSVDSVLGHWFFSVREPVEKHFFAIAVLLLFVSYVCVFLFACAVKMTDAKESRLLRLSDKWVGVSFLLVPAVMAAAIAGGVAINNARTDAAAHALTVQWDDMQVRAAELRSDIAPTNWYLVFAHASKERGSTPETTYKVFSQWEHASKDSFDEVKQEAITAAANRGWDLHPLEGRNDDSAAESVAFEGVDASGYTLFVRVESPDYGEPTVLELSFTSPPVAAVEDMWIDWRSRMTEKEKNEDLKDHPFPADAWPTLAHAESARL